MLKRIVFISLSSLLLFLISLSGYANLISEWKFDGNADDSIGRNNASLKGTPSWTANRFADPKKALAFNGTNSFVNCGNHISLSFGDGKKDKPFSIGWWQKSNRIPDLHKRKGAPVPVLEKKGEYYIKWSNVFRFHLIDVNSNAFIGRRGGVAVKKGTWTHILITYDGSGHPDGIKFYQDGKLVNSSIEKKGKYIAVKRGEYPLTIGRLGYRFFDGAIDDVRIYDHELSPEEYKQIYSQIPAPLKLKRGASDRDIEIPRTLESPQIDGSISDKLWRKIKWYSDFRCFDNLQKAADPKTSFAVCHDRENLYIAVRADEPEMKTIISQNSILPKNSIEVFVDTEGTGMFHYQFIINAKGELHEYKAIRGGTFCDSKRVIGAKVAVKAVEDAWFVEMAIPLSSLSFNIEEPDISWGVNISRNRFITRPRELYTYAPVKNSFHDNKNFAGAKIRDINLKDFAWNVSLESIRTILEKGKLLADINLRIKNDSQTSKKVKLVAELNVDGQKTSSKTEIVEFGNEAKSLHISVPVEKLGKGILTLLLQDVKSRQIIHRYSQKTAISYTPLQVQVLYPCYRNTFFAAQKADEIKLEITTCLESRAGYVFNFSLASGKEILHRFSSKIKSDKMTCSIPLPGLQDGNYHVQGELVYQPTGKIITGWQDVLYKLKHQKGEVRFDENMVCLIDDKPFLPFGICNNWNQGGVQEAIEIGCNVVEHFGVLRRGSSKRVDEYFEKLHQAGLKLLVYPYPGKFPYPQGGKYDLSKPLNTKQEETLRSHLRKIKHYPEILAWYTANEPQPAGGWGPHAVSAETMRQINEVVNKEDPYHPTAILLKAKDISYYAGAADIICPDEYPNFRKNGGWIRPISPYKSVLTAIRAGKGRKPAWAILQAHDRSLFKHGKGQRAPNFIDLRSQLYQAVAAGAKGFFWYCRYWIEADVKIGLTYLARECNLLREVIFTHESPWKFSATNELGNQHRNLILSRREQGNDSYFFVVSSSSNSEKAKFNISNFTRGKLFVLGEKREIQIERGGFSDVFKPYETHIYTTNKDVADSLNIADVYKAIKEMCKPIIKSGNLAHKSNKVLLKASKKMPKHLPSIDFAIDGVKGTYGLAAGGSGIEMTFPEPHKISKMIIDSNIPELNVEANLNGIWKKLASAKMNKKSPLREVQNITFPSVETRKLRLVLPKRNLASYKIWEIELYEK